MTRMTFPQDRATFVYQGPNQPILTPPRTGIELFTDGSGEHPADITDLGGVAISTSVVFTGDDGLMPEFLGPDDGTLLLYAQVLGTRGLYAVEARFSDALRLVRSEQSLVADHGPPGPHVGILGGFYFDEDTQELWGPKKEPSAWPINPIRLAHQQAGPRFFDYPIGIPSTEVLIDHPLNNPFPSVDYTDPEGELVLCDVSYLTPSRVAVRFGIPATGVVHLKE